MSGNHHYRGGKGGRYGGNRRFSNRAYQRDQHPQSLPPSNNFTTQIPQPQLLQSPQPHLFQPFEPYPLTQSGIYGQSPSFPTLRNNILFYQSPKDFHVNQLIASTDPSYSVQRVVYQQSGHQPLSFSIERAEDFIKMEKLDEGDCPPFDPSAFSKFPFQNIQVYKSEDWNFLFRAKQFQSKISPLLEQWIKEGKDRANTEIAELAFEKTSEGFQKLPPFFPTLLKTIRS